ncbi:MAG: host specificity factor TipJ family phage tail protein [Alphaproteobacteria bacterium]
MTVPETAPPRDITAVVVPHPFSAARVQKTFPAGLSLAEIVAETQPDKVLSRHAHVSLSGDDIPRERWPRIYPKPGAHLTIRMVPMGGGGGKNPLRTVLSLALVAVVPVISGGIAGLFGATGTLFGRIISTGVSIVSRLALNALAPPARPRFSGQKESPTLFIQGAQNNAYPFGRIPKVLGKHRLVPPLGALPYTETVGPDQYLRMLFVWGYGPLHISDLKIGETPLSKFDAVEIETRAGYPDDTPLTLYSNSIIQNDLQVLVKSADGYILRTTEADADEISVDITFPRGLFRFNGASKAAAAVQIEMQYAPAGTSDWSASGTGFTAYGSRNFSLGGKPKPYKSSGTTYTVTRIDRIYMDEASGKLGVAEGAEFRSGIDTGNPEVPQLPANALALAAIERRSDDPEVIPSSRITDERDPGIVGVNTLEAGDFLVSAAGTANTVIVAAGSLQFPGLVITAKQSSSLRKTISFKVDKGQYDVRLRRVTADSTDDDIFDEAIWTALRTIRYVYPVNMPGLAMTALRIKATDQLNGVIDRFNGVVHSILPDWDGTAWTDQVTSNPASLFRHVLQGKANARPLLDSRLDLPKIVTWHGDCATAGREFNAVIDYDTSVRDVLADVAAAGRASPTLIDGKWAVISDKPQSVPVQHFTARNTVNFEGRKAFAELPQALRVRFINRRKGWLQDERLVYDDGHDADNTLRYETLDLAGITDPDQAWKDGRYHIATARLRPETYSFSCDIEHIVCTRGDLIRFTHDVPLFGLMSARVKSLITSGSNATGVVLDAEVEMEAGKNYAVRFRKGDGSSLITALQTVPGASKTIVFTAPIATDGGPAAGDLSLFGEAGSESVELVVKSISPQNHLSARLTCVDAAPAVHLADTGPIPAFDSQITVPPELQRPPAPVLASIQSGEEALMRHTDGSLTTRILIALEAPVFGPPLLVRARIRAQDETTFHPAETLSPGQYRLSITDVTEGESYDIEMRYVSAAGINSDALLIAGHRVEGTSALPADVADFIVSTLGDTAHLSWSPVADLDLDHYALRFSPQLSDAGWNSAVDLVARIAPDATSLSVPAAAGTYLLKAVDVGGRFSANAAMAVTAIDGLPGQNTVLTVTESPGFTGICTETGVSDGALQLAGSDSIDDWPDVDTIQNTDIGNDGVVLAGSYAFAQAVDLGAIYTSRLTADIAVSGIDLNSTIDTWDDVDLFEDFDGAADPSLWSLVLQLRFTRDNPAGSPDWSGWMPFVIGDYTARAFQFRVLLASALTNVTPSLSALTVYVDMPDRTVSGRSIASAAGGSTVSFAAPFRDTPAIAITPRDLATGDYYALTAPSSASFGIRFFNSAGAGISRTFDYLARGYGEQI